MATTTKEATPDRRRRTFGPVVGLGIAAAGATAVAGAKHWAVGSGSGVQGAGVGVAGLSTGDMPAVNALGLLCLACWGVVLVTRGWWRRAVGILGVVAALGALVAVVAGYGSVAATVRAAFVAAGAGDVDVHRTVWVWIAALVAVLDLVATVLAVLWAPGWPEMGRKYDAPTGAPVPEATVPVEDLESIDLWRAMDDGRDPTA